MFWGEIFMDDRRSYEGRFYGKKPRIPVLWQNIGLGTLAAGVLGLVLYVFVS